MQSHQPVALLALNEASRVAAPPETLDAAFFPLERIRGPILCLAADDDQIWNSSLHCELALAHLHAHRHQFADAMISYPEAGHLFLNAESGPGSAMNRIQTASFEMVFGGTPEGDARAAADAWPRIHAFLAAALK
jgi:dienelactone hydrolase